MGKKNGNRGVDQASGKLLPKTYVPYVEPDKESLAESFTKAVNEKPRYVMIKRDLIKPDLIRNVRDEVMDYDVLKPVNAGLINDINTYGYDVAQPLTVHLEPDGTYDLLDGTRRFIMSGHAGVDTLPCVVLHGLTAVQKYMKIINFGQRENPGPIGIRKAVDKCMSYGMGRDRIAEKLGMRTKDGKPQASQVQLYMELINLPTEVNNEWIENHRFPDRADKKFDTGWKSIKRLHEARMADEDKKIFLSDGGPEFKRILAGLKRGEKPDTKRNSKDEVTGRSLVVLAEREKSQEGKDLLNALAGVTGTDIPAALDAVIKPVEHVKSLRAAAESISQPHLRLLIFGVKGLDGDAYNSAIASILQTVMSACEAGLILHPDDSTLPECNVPAPVADKPVADKPVADKPVADKPVADKPVAKRKPARVR